jgi:hypothetical protein
MRACRMYLVCDQAPAGDGTPAGIAANLSHTLARGRYNRADPGEHELRPGRPASQPLAMLCMVPFLGGGAACRAARKRRSRL